MLSLGLKYLVLLLLVAGQLKILFFPFTRLRKLMSQFFHQHVTLFNPQGETLVARCSMENPGRETKVSVLKKYKTEGAKSHTVMDRNLQHFLD